MSKLTALGVMVLLIALQGCDSDRPVELPDQGCINTAKAEMIRRGINFDQFLQREGEFSKYIWINDKLFIVDDSVPPTDHTKIHLHNSYTHGARGKGNSLHPFPSVDAVQKISIDKFKEANPEIIQSQPDHTVPFMVIKLDCDSRPAEVLNKNETLDDIIIKNLYKRPNDLHVGFDEKLGAHFFYSDTKSPGVYYVLVSDGKIDNRYPVLMCDKGDKGVTCHVAFMYKKGVRLSYTFSGAQLNDWVRLHDFIMKAMDQSYQKGSN